MLRRSVIPLLVGTFILRLNGGAGNIILGRFLAELSLHHGRVITNINVGLLAVAFFVTELTLGPILGLIQVSLLLFTPAENPLPYLVSLQVLAGMSSAMQVPAVLGYLADYTAQNPARRMRFMSFYELATSGGLAAGVAVGGLA